MNGEETTEDVAGRQQLPRLQTLAMTYHTEHESTGVFHISSTFPLRNHEKYGALDALPRHSCGVDFSFQEVRGELRHPGQFLVEGKKKKNELIF